MFILELTADFTRFIWSRKVEDVMKISFSELFLFIRRGIRPDRENARTRDVNMHEQYLNCW